MKRSIIPAIVLLALGLLLILPNHGRADNPGIIKARLLQASERSYVLEADVTKQLASAIQTPIFPARFQVSKLDYITQSGGDLVVQATATTSGESLSTQDTILLPWEINGVAITVQWLDGTMHQELFMRSLEGINVPMVRLMPSDKTLADVGREQVLVGLKHLSFQGIHLAFVGVLVLLFPTRQLFQGLLYYALGQACSLLLVDLGLPGFELLFVEVLGVVLILMLAYTAVRKRSVEPYLPLLFIFGLLHSLAYGQELLRLDLPWEYKLPALFIFNVTVDSGQIAIAILLCLMVNIWGQLGVKGQNWRWRYRYPLRLNTLAAYAIGVFSVALLIGLFHQYALIGKTDILNFGTAQNPTQLSLPTSQNTLGGGRQPIGARQLTKPVMAYLSVEPYEVRQETLIQTRAAVQFLGLNDAEMESISIDSLETVKNGILNTVQQANSLSIDGQPVKPTLARADFVTLRPTGVTFRDRPVRESLDEGIIGLTLVYSTSDLANEISMEWQLFSDTVQQVQATTTDPFSITTTILSRTDNIWRWESQLSGYQVSVIESIEVQKRSLPVISGILLTMALVLLLVSIRQPKIRPSRSMFLSMVGLGFALYPFLRFPVNVPWVSHWKPSPGRASVILNGLLTNVYRSFELRDESAVYDRLAISVMGEQLTEIYLQNRRSLELENRGGARANVDDVQILSVNSIRRSEQNGFTADTLWTVSGSVTHFGHTHYRRNQYRAWVTFVRQGDVWKIRDLELIDEQRVI